MSRPKSIEELRKYTVMLNPETLLECASWSVSSGDLPASIAGNQSALLRWLIRRYCIEQGEKHIKTV